MCVYGSLLVNPKPQLMMLHFKLIEIINKLKENLGKRRNQSKFHYLSQC